MSRAPERQPDPRKRALQMNAGSQISNILHPIVAIPKGVVRTNHSQNNRQALKATQVRNALKREEEEAKAAEEPFKMARFRGVESVLRQKNADGTLGHGIARSNGDDAIASRRTISSGGLTSKMGSMSMNRRGPASAQQQRTSAPRVASVGNGSKSATNAPQQRLQYNDEEDDEENIYAQRQQQQYDDEDDDGGGDLTPRQQQYEEDDQDESQQQQQQYGRQQQQQPQYQSHSQSQSQQGRRPQQQQQQQLAPQYDEDEESLNGLMAGRSGGISQQQQQHGQQQGYGGPPRGINSIRVPSSQSQYGSEHGGNGERRSFITENAKKVIQTSKVMASARSNYPDEYSSRGGGGGGQQQQQGEFLSSTSSSSYGAGVGASIQKHDNYGRVPAYIQAQKAEAAARLAEEQAQQSKKDLGIPEGMILMPEEQRLNTLAVLQENHKKVLYDISSFPLRVETISRKKAKAELEAKLEEIEKALQLFSRKRVLIQP